MQIRPKTQINLCSTSTGCRFAIYLCFAMALLTVVFTEATSHAQNSFRDFNATDVFRQMNVDAAASPAQLVPSWWDRHVQNSLREVQPLPADLHTILYLAIHHSNQIKIAKADPLIRETAVQEADSAFDWVRYLDTAWNDTSEPVSNSLTVGGNENRFKDQVFQATGGVRRTTRSGGQLDISQRFGWQDNNSQFFIPNDQATGRMTLSYTHPLLRGRGAAYNNAVVFLAQVDSQVANDEFLAILQDELLEITRAYWNLHLERAVLAHQLRLYLRTQEIYRTLSARQAVDTQGTQLTLTASALESRRADLIRAQTAVTNSETRLRGMINAQELGNSDQTELIPVEPLPTFHYHTNLQSEIQVALQNRPEVRAAIQQVRAGSTRLGVAQHEMLPALNLVTQSYVDGLRGDSEFSDAFADQFSVGRPSYSVGLQYELPVGNRLAKARVCRRQHELTRLQSEYSRALEAVQTEVDIAVREINTAHQEITAKSRALAAAESEVTTIEKRWQRMIDGSGTSSLNLESLLRAQERVTAAEGEYVTSRLTYSLAMVNLKRANGTLLQSEAVSVNKTCGPNGCNDIILDKGLPASAGQSQMAPVEMQLNSQFAQPDNYFSTNAVPMQTPTIATQPATQFVSQPVTQFVTQPTAQAQPVMLPVAQPAQFATQQRAQPYSQPRAQPMAQPYSQPTAQPYSRPAAQPAPSAQGWDSTVVGSNQGASPVQASNAYPTTPQASDSMIFTELPKQ